MAKMNWQMRKRHHKKLVHEENYVAEVDIELIDTDEGWSPYLSFEDVRESLRRGDLAAASRLARVFTLTPVAASLLPENRVARGFSPPAPHHLASAWADQTVREAYRAVTGYRLKMIYLISNK